ncbi:hypothetical protein ANO11243_037950 [Dothideomycetidae sp. 11243]|nr:hypothetical protein ANO11243_037950 [fungal sp. No.11243]
MLDSIARAGRHAAPLVRPGIVFRPLHLVTSARYSHGSTQISDNPAPNVQPNQIVPHPDSATISLTSDAKVAPRNTTGDISARDGGNTSKHVQPKLDDISLSRRRQKAVISQIEGIKARRSAEREMRKSRYGMDMGQWREVTDLLLANLPRQPRFNHTTTIVVKVPPEAERKNQRDLREVFTEILLKYRCRTRTVHVYPSPKDGEVPSRYIVMRGPPSSIASARRHLYSIYNALVPVNQDEAKAIMKSSAAKSVISAWPKLPFQYDRLISEIVLPPTMTVTSFATYVDELIASRPSRLKLKTEPGDSTNPRALHFEKVAQSLVSLFKSNQHRSSWSLYAISLALRFLGKHRMIPAQRQVFEELHKANAIESPEVFAAILEATAKAQDLKNFRYIVQVMIASGFTPGWDIWNLFVRLIQDFDADAADQVVKTMRDKGFLKSPAVRVQMAETLCHLHYSEWIESGGASERFFVIYDKLWDGAKWLTHSSVHVLLTYHVRRGEFKRAHSILETYKRSGGRYNAAHLEVLLLNARKYRYPKAALAAVDEILGARFPPPVTPLMYETLFTLAIDERCLDLACAVWQEAFAHGHISYQMMTLVSSCLYQERGAKHKETVDDESKVNVEATMDEAAKQQAKPVSAREKFEAAAGAAILKLTVEILEKHRTPVVVKHFPNPTELKTKNQPYARVKLLRRLLRSPQRYQPTKPLAETLRLAWARDEYCKSRKSFPRVDEVVRVEMTPLPVSMQQRTFSLKDAPVTSPSTTGRDDSARIQGKRSANDRLEQWMQLPEDEVQDLWGSEKNRAEVEIGTGPS